MNDPRSSTNPGSSVFAETSAKGNETPAFRSRRTRSCRDYLSWDLQQRRLGFGETHSHLYIGKTKRTFQKRWSGHVNKTGVNHKDRTLKESAWAPSTHILLDFTLVPANYQTASLLGGLKVVMNAILGGTTGQGKKKRISS